MPYLDSWCNNALNLSSDKLIVKSDLPFGTYCQWLISAVDDKHYVNLEFENIDVRITELNYIYHLLLILIYFIQIKYWENRLYIHDGANEQHMKIGEVYGNTYNKLLKSISSSGMSMFIDFKKQYQSQTEDENSNFTALIKYKKKNFDCQTLLDINKNILMSPHHSTDITNCSWLITSNFGSYLILDFTFIEVNSYSYAILVDYF